MMLLPSRHHLRRLTQRTRPLLTLLAVLVVLDALLLVHHRPRTVRAPLTAQQQQLLLPTVFIASVHRNTADLLPTWGAAVLALAAHLGPSRVYFSAVESGSQDTTKAQLGALKAQLDAAGVPNTVDLGMTVYQQLDELWARPDPAGPRQPGWIWNEADGVYDLRRITYLAKERNRAMEPLAELQRTAGVTFDKVLWINDVVFDVSFARLTHYCPLFPELD